MEPDWDLYPNFSREEFVCKCGCDQADMDDGFVSTLQTYREAVNAPLVITSGYRCEEHNYAIGGAPNSAHVQGKAVDLVRPLGNSFVSVSEAMELFNGIGLRLHGSNQYMHVDLADRDAVWTYV